jgi:hypothetical protein
MADLSAFGDNTYSATSRVTLPPEVELLLLCAKVHLDADKQLLLQKLATRPDLDWGRFLQLAIRHGVVPLAHAQLKACCWPDIPAASRAELENRHRAIVFRNLQFTGELVRLERIFATESIQTVWFKGPVLAQQAYANLTSREFSDLDILVPRERIDRVSQILRDQGYTPLYDLTTPRQQHLHEKISNEHAFWNPQKGICVDVHWALTKNVYSFSNRRPLATCGITLAGQRITTFCIEETLCYLCYHGCKHAWDMLRWVSDIVGLIRRNPELDWDSLTTSARLPIGSPKMLRLGLFLAHFGLSAPLPHPVIAWTVSDRKVVSVGHRILKRPTRRIRLFKRSVYTATMDSLWDRLLYWTTVVWEPTALELERIVLPDLLFCLYRLLRYIRLLGKYALKLLRFPWSTLSPE